MTRREYNRIARSYSNNLYKFVLFHVGNEAASQDLVQETFLKLWENRRKVEAEKAVKWLFVAARNLYLNHVRHQKVVRVHAENADPVQYVENNSIENQDLIRQCLTGMPEIQKTVMLLRDLEGYDYRTIGEVTGLSESQVKVYLFRARKRFKNTYQTLENESGSIPS